MFNVKRATGTCDTCQRHGNGNTVVIVTDDGHEAGSVAHTCDSCDTTETARCVALVAGEVGDPLDATPF